MLSLINNATAQRWAVTITLGLLIANLTSIHHWQFWALAVILFINERLIYRSGVEDGIVIGVKLPANKQAQIVKIVDNEDEESDDE